VAADPKIALNGNRKFNPAQPWRIEDSLDLYNVTAWGKGYFSVNGAGHVVVRPDTTEEREIDLLEVVEGLQARDLSTPVVVRFSDILAHRLKRLHDAFASAITEKTSSMNENGTSSWKRSLMELTKIMRGRRQRSGWSSRSG